MASLLLSGENLPEESLDGIRSYLAEDRDARLKRAALQEAFLSSLRSAGPVPRMADAEREWPRLAGELGLNPDLDHYLTLRAGDAANADEKHKTPDATVKNTVPFFRRMWPRVAAVTIPVMAAAGFYLSTRGPADTTFTIAAADYVQEVFLPDSTHVSVNPHSSLVYRTTEHSRDVELSGEAFFAVRRDTLRPFSVSTGSVKLTVLGTDFRMSEFSDGTSAVASLFQGSLNVEGGGASSILAWGERLTLDRATGETAVTIIPAREMIAAGYKPRLVFDRATSGEVIEALAAYHGVEIETDPALDLSGGELIVDFEGEPLEAALEILSIIGGKPMAFAIDGDKVTITKAK
jgi:ferric-dicitrate binding protein FerR (iron transport regulator)